MTTKAQLDTIVLMDKLTPEQQEKVLAYAQSMLPPETSAPKATSSKWEFGVFKGKISMSTDFDEPMEEFKDYM